MAMRAVSYTHLDVYKRQVMEIAQYYTDAFFSDCAKLNIKTPDTVQPATGCIDEYIKTVSYTHLLPKRPPPPPAARTVRPS